MTVKAIEAWLPQFQEELQMQKKALQGLMYSPSYARTILIPGSECDSL